jgi:transposase
MSAAQADSAPSRSKSTRRSWSRLEKRRIVEEAFRPGASVADVARSYGLNANQVFNWRRRALAAAAKTKSNPAAPDAALLPVGTIVQGSDGQLALAQASLAPATEVGPPNLPTAPHPAPGGRTGLIEIDLTCGTRLRVDALVDEHALRRVLSVVKSSS